MKILIMNRRDTGNPVSGGAEVFTLEIAKGLVRRGAEVTIFSSRFKGSLKEETVDGIRHIRGGNELTSHLHGFLYALIHRRDYDLFLDEYNGLGFGGFLLPRCMMHIHQLYGEFWMRELGKPGYIPYLIEPWILRMYRRTPTVALSLSTVRDLQALGFGKVDVVSVGIFNKPLEIVPEKEPTATMIFLGRLRSTKNPADVIRIFMRVKESLPDLRLWLVGRGPDEEALREMCQGVEGIEFKGFVDEDTKLDLLRRAHLQIVPGVREGFGINVVEAASQGTPSIGYDVHGLRDSIKDGKTGLLATGVEDASDKALALFQDHEQYMQMARAGLEYAREFDWDRRAGEYYDVITRIAREHGWKV